MNQVNKIVLLCDENTSQAGLAFMAFAEKILEKKGLIVHSLMIRPTENIMDAVYQFDRIMSVL